MVDLQGQAVAAILTRAPSAGGKTRLFESLGRHPDPELLRALFLDTLDAARASRARCVVCFTPANAEAEMRALAGDDVALLAQRGEDLGERMRCVFDDLLAAGASAVVLIGSDLPLLDPQVIDGALQVLSARPGTIVLGPARDGGYYLIGATTTPSPLFDRMTWSHGDVLVQTERRAREAGLPTYQLAQTADVDTMEGLGRVMAEAGPRGERTRQAAARLGIR
jgi:uncharacterized protein